MRVVADIATASILQSEKSPEVGDSRPFNGKFAVPIPEMVAVDVTSSSYVLPVDGGDVTSLAMANLLVEFPMYSNIVFNPLLTATDVADLDLTASFPNIPAEATRAIVGRGTGVLPTGIVPNVVGVLPQNDRVTPSRPGILISDTIDIGPMTSSAGADEFMVWWKLYDLSTTDDVSSDFGATSGRNDPALRNLVEVDSEASGFEVWLSHDDGVTYTQMNRLTPTDFGTYGTLLRIAFRNTDTSNRRYVASYAIMF
jgi:hypothetical protein